ncbi:RDD family protein [Cellulomonas soli]
MDEGIVTGEGVLLDARPASFASRALGAVIDLLLLGVVGFIAVMVLVATGAVSSDQGARIVGVVLLATGTVIVPTTVETLTRGRSLGKLIAGIRIVRDDGGPIVFRQAFVRALVGVGELWAAGGSVALISSMVHPQGKRIGDMLAGTYAVRVRGKAPRRDVLPMPPHLARWAQDADIARLPDGLALSARQFVLRAGRLHPASRVELGSELTAQVQRYVRPLPPPGTHPESFLVAVLAERRTRELEAQLRAASRDSREAALLHRLPHGVPDPVD